MKAKLMSAGGSLEALSPHLESFFSQLVMAGYASRTLRRKRYVLKEFSRWISREQIELLGLTDIQIAAFVGRLPESRKSRIKLEWATLRRLPEHLRAYIGFPTSPLKPEPLPEVELLARYINYLRTNRGLMETSILVYAPVIRGFIADQSSRTGAVSPDKFDALTVQEFLLNCSRAGRSSESIRLTAIALRSFFRFLLQSGEASIDLSLSVPAIRKWGKLAAHSFLSPEDVEKTASTPDLSTQRGRRDHAILLLLARLGLRAGEVVALELDDIRWRSGEIVVR